MKSIRLIGYLWMAVIGSGQLIAAEQNESQNPNIIPFLDMSEGILQDFSEGKMRDCILEVSEDACLPLRLSLKGELLALESPIAEPMYLKILQTCYVRCDEQYHFLFSTDQKQWNELDEFFSGELKASVHVENQGPVVGFELELHQRQTE